MSARHMRYTPYLRRLVLLPRCPLPRPPLAHSLSTTTPFPLFRISKTLASSSPLRRGAEPHAFLQRNLQSARASAHYITMMCKLGIPLCPRSVKNLAQSLVFSVMEFGIQIWGPFCPPRNIVERDSFRLFVIRQSMRLHPFWKDCPRGPRIYPSSSLVLRLDRGISPVKHRIAELTFRYWNRVLTMSTASPLRRSFVQWFTYFTRASAPPVVDNWFRAAGAIFATYGLSRFFLAMTPVPYGELSEAFVNLWTKHEMDYADRPACNGRLLHYVPIIEALAAKGRGYIHKLTSDERGSFSAKKRVITIYKLGMASYLSSCMGLPPPRP